MHIKGVQFSLIIFESPGFFPDKTPIITVAVEITVKNGIDSGADSIGHGSTCPHFYKWLGTGGGHRE